tara:strand:- start:1073 stop:2026 length:954 start_codon:yes stop_codon:yes gene_type:complete
MTNSTTAIESSQLPVIAGHEITTDQHGRFSLNAIHKASGEGEHKRPSKWTVTAQAKELIDELESQSPESGFAPIGSKHGGSGRGTFAHELLAVSYAGWISPRFQLQVNQVFLDYRMGKLESKARNEALPNPLTPDHQRGIQKAVARRAQALPKGLQRLAYSRLYSHLKDRFGVAKYDQIPDEQYSQALAAVETCDLEGEWMPAPEEPTGRLDIHYPLERWSEINSGLAYAWKHQPPLGCKGRQARFVRPEHVSGDPAHSVSPTLMLLGDLVAAGYDVGACRAEVQAMRSMLDDLSSVNSRIQEALGRQVSYPVIFSQ